MRLAFDIESDGLIPEMTGIHSLVLVDVETGRGWSCTDHPGYVSPLGYEVLPIDEGLRMLMEADEIIGHNIIKFDIPAIRKVKPWFNVARWQVNDTLINSRLIWPELRENDWRLKRRMPDFPGYLMGSHGLEAWGLRLGEWKGDYSKEMKAKGLDPWANWNVEMQEYCEQDVTVTIKFLELIESKGYSARAIEIERDFAWILAEMERNGFPLDLAKAGLLQQRLMRRRAELHADLMVAFPPITDTWKFTPKVNNKKLGYKKGVTITKTAEVVFNPGSRDHIARWLKQKYGWKPSEYTDGGKPKIDERVLKKLKYPEAQLLAEYFLVDKRLSMLEGRGGKGLIPYAKKGKGVIHGSVTTNGAVTRRCTHSSPNMAQLPAVNVPYGREFRELMYAPDGWSLLGWDASGLELRCFAHYMSRYDGGKYTTTVLSGDIHWVHVQALGLVEEGTEYDEHDDHHNHSRNKVAKRFISMG
jgi:hypothetical protein